MISGVTADAVVRAGGGSAALLLIAALYSPARAEVVIEAYTGVSHTRSSDLRISQPASASDAEFRDVRWAGRPFEDAPTMGWP